MARWTGFSDEELQKLKIASDEQIPSHMMRQGRPQAAVTPQRSKGRGEQGARGAALGTRASEQSKPQTTANMKRDQEPRLEKGGDIKAKVDVSIKEEISKQKETGEEIPPIGDVELLRVGTSSPTVEDCGMRQEISRLEQLKQQQKIMEEHNKQKHAELIQQLAARTRRTAAESVKLQKLQRELQNLDFTLANDVSILRSRIDQAECAYSSARKQYDRAEAKFVAAKMELHRRVEVKELLTEHLCLVIGQSEARKSSRLDELTRKLKDWDLAEDEKESAKDINRGAEVEENAGSLGSSRIASRYREMKPAVVVDEMFPEGAGPYVDLDEAGGSSGLLMDLAANEKAVHGDFYNDFDDLFDDDDIQ